jgi:Do/DeqQ family serine protease
MRAHRVLIPTLALVAACGTSAASLAQALPSEGPRVVPVSALSMKQSFAPIVRRAAPAVVNISSKRTVRQQDPFWSRFGVGVPRERVEGSLGSGVIVRSDGVIVTNNHVIAAPGSEITVALFDRREFVAKVLLADPRTDLAVLKIDLPPGEKLPTMPISERADSQVGDLVLAIGDPFGVGQTVTNGIISALNRTPDRESDAGAYIQTDAAINPGNSGGALVDMDGNLIGINSMIVSRSGGSSGVGFAIPAPMVRRVVETAMGGGHTLVRSWLGAKTDPITGDIAKSIGLNTPQGALVTNLYPGGPAARAGLKVGDVVTAVNGAAIADPANLNFHIATLKPGQTAQVAYLRDGRAANANVRVEAPSGADAIERALTGATPLAGATVSELTPAVADTLGMDPFNSTGVVLTKVSPRSYAGNLGFQPGDVIRGVNGRQVTSVGDLQTVLSAGARGVWTVTVQRGGQTITARFRA